ncbi:hypothetical protein BC940DRAFT_343264 [Gongronella butleri]|nr:hypothetical protein BC940DRAFT_343264 [Gongronella butleri]
MTRQQSTSTSLTGAAGARGSVVETRAMRRMQPVVQDQEAVVVDDEVANPEVQALMAQVQAMQARLDDQDEQLRRQEDELAVQNEGDQRQQRISSLLGHLPSQTTAATPPASPPDLFDEILAADLAAEGRRGSNGDVMSNMVPSPLVNSANLNTPAPPVALAADPGVIRASLAPPVAATAVPPRARARVVDTNRDQGTIAGRSGRRRRLTREQQRLSLDMGHELRREEARLFALNGARWFCEPAVNFDHPHNQVLAKALIAKLHELFPLPVERANDPAAAAADRRFLDDLIQKKVVNRFNNRKRLVTRRWTSEQLEQEHRRTRLLSRTNTKLTRRTTGFARARETWHDDARFAEEFFGVGPDDVRQLLVLDVMSDDETDDEAMAQAPGGAKILRRLVPSVRSDTCNEVIARLDHFGRIPQGGSTSANAVVDRTLLARTQGVTDRVIPALPIWGRRAAS